MPVPSGLDRGIPRRVRCDPMDTQRLGMARRMAAENAVLTVWTMGAEAAYSIEALSLPLLTAEYARLRGLPSRRTALGKVS